MRNGRHEKRQVRNPSVQVISLRPARDDRRLINPADGYPVFRVWGQSADNPAIKPEACLAAKEKKVLISGRGRVPCQQRAKDLLDLAPMGRP